MLWTESNTIKADKNGLRTRMKRYAFSVRQHIAYWQNAIFEMSEIEKIVNILIILCYLLGNPIIYNSKCKKVF